MRTETGELLFELDTDLLYRSAYEKGREDAIEECVSIIKNFNPLWTFSPLKHVVERLEQLKEQNND